MTLIFAPARWIVGGVTSLQAVVAGVAAGLAVAVPLGAVGTLVLDLGLRHGTRSALAAGMGVATVDGLYATAAAAFGASLAATLAAAERTVSLAAAAVLAAVAVLLLRAALARRTERREDAVAQTASSPPPRAPRVYARFVALTSVNPTTAATFAAVAAGLPAAGADDLSAAAAGAFVLGAATASAGWHALLATASGAAGRRLPPSARTWTGVAGALLALALAVRLALAA